MNFQCPIAVLGGAAVFVSALIGHGAESEFTMPGGTYSLYLDQALFWGRPTVVSDVFIPDSGSTSLNVELPTDYSCAFGSNSSAWGSDPWTSWSDVWYQTFVATGDSITGVNFKLAGTNADVTDEAVSACPVGAILKKRVGFKVPIGQRKWDHTPIGAEVETK